MTFSASGVGSGVPVGASGSSGVAVGSAVEAAVTIMTRSTFGVEEGSGVSAIATPSEANPHPRKRHIRHIDSTTIAVLFCNRFNSYSSSQLNRLIDKNVPYCVFFDKFNAI